MDVFLEFNVDSNPRPANARRMLCWPVRTPKPGPLVRPIQNLNEQGNIIFRTLATIQ
ncbi:hypothetical protein J6590_095149 [Homalodisca vitripennis]|nr:hypothetical protein J6590_095149 [Homalodisca vitripennis]